MLLVMNMLLREAVNPLPWVMPLCPLNLIGSRLSSAEALGRRKLIETSIRLVGSMCLALGRWANGLPLFGVILMIPRLAMRLPLLVMNFLDVAELLTRIWVRLLLELMKPIELASHIQALFLLTEEAPRQRCVNAGYGRPLGCLLGLPGTTRSMAMLPVFRWTEALR